MNDIGKLYRYLVAEADTRVSRVSIKERQRHKGVLWSIVKMLKSNEMLITKSI